MTGPINQGGYCIGARTGRSTEWYAKKFSLPNDFLGVMTEIMKRGRHSCLPIVHVVSSKTQYGIAPLILSMAEVYGTPWGDTGGYADSRSFKKF